jgi:DinB superfamily
VNHTAQPSRLSRMVFVPRLALLAGMLAVAGTASAQSMAATTGPSISIETLRATGLRDMQVMQDKIMALAEEIPESKYDYRPMDGTRSVRDVLLLIAGENFGMLGEVFGVRPPTEFADGKAGINRLNAITAKTDVIRQLKASVASVRAGLSSVQPDAEMNIPFFNGLKRPFNVALGAVLADQHEHLGQLIAYARANSIVPPWSKKSGM